MSRVNVAIVRLRFGAEFIPIYRRPPHAIMYAICRRTRARLKAVPRAPAATVKQEREAFARAGIQAPHMREGTHEQ